VAKDPPIPALGRLRVVGFGALAARVRAAPPRCGGTRLVCVDGPSAAGKTVLAERLARALDGPPVVHMDDLYAGWDGLEDGVRLLRAEVVEPLVAGADAGYRRYDWYAGRYAERVALGRPDVLVVEGVGAGASADHASLVIWLDAPERVRHRRGMARDGGAYEPYWDRWAAQERAHFAAAGTRDRADVHVDGAPTGIPYTPETEAVLSREWKTGL
jgi:uridine kinase